MADSYTQSITNVNNAIEALENGSVIVGKSQKADNATDVSFAGNSPQADHANSVKKAGIADIAASVEKLSAKRTCSIAIKDGEASSCTLDEGIYVAVFRYVTYGILYAYSGILAVETGKISYSYIGKRYSKYFIEYDSLNKTIGVGYFGSSSMYYDHYDGTLYIYKIAELKEED